MKTQAPIGIFDSGYGGLTILQEISARLPEYDYIYLGDNARTPYGTRSFDAVYRFTLEGVKKLFDMGCRLVVLACNTASAKALRSIQQNYLPGNAPDRRVLGVLRPTTEIIGNYTSARHIGIFATTGTVQSNSYSIEIRHFFPDIKVFQQACPLWVPLVENNEHTGEGADYFVKKYVDLLLQQSDKIDAILLACTHYPLLIEKIKKYTDNRISIISQGEIVANSLADYLTRHSEIDLYCSKSGKIEFFTTDSPDLFDQHAKTFYNSSINSHQIELG